MKLEHEFYQLPLRFDVARMQEEIAQFSEADWRAHPSGYDGNSALILVSSRGEQNDSVDQPMQATPFLERCPYLQQVLASFKTVVGRTRLMRLAPGALVKQHCDVNYYWRTHTRVHIPIITHPSVTFTTRGKSVHMQAGHAWTFDNWSMHNVINPSAITRVHLVFDTIGTAVFWKLVQAGLNPKVKPQRLMFDPKQTARLVTEQFTPAAVMSPAELALCLRDIAGELDADAGMPEDIQACQRMLADLEHDWASLWMVHGPQAIAWPLYEKLLSQTRKRLADVGKRLRVPSNGLCVTDVLEPVLLATLNKHLLSDQPSTAAGKPTPAANPIAATTAEDNPPSAPRARRRRKPAVVLDRPVIILAAPRSGSTLLYETLATNRNLFTVGGESHRQIEGIAALHPAQRHYASNRLTAKDATAKVSKALRAAFIADLISSDGVAYADLPDKLRPDAVRLLEKTPKNALRIPFLRAVFPDARFIYLTRDARDNVSSLLDSWRSGRYTMYKDLPDWDGPPWSHLLIPGWERLKGASLVEIVQQQWRVTHEIILTDLKRLPADQWCSVRYESLVNDTENCIRRLCAFAEIPFGPRMQQQVTQPLKPSRYTLTAPDPEKWRNNADELAEALPNLGALNEKLRALENRQP